VSSDIFNHKNVMVIVPNEDDDLNLVSGVIDLFVEGKSEIYPVFVTNGDYEGKGILRINEAIDCWKKIGVEEDNIIFLGYGDQWLENGPHIYNAQPDEKLTSYSGNTKTYGTDTHPAYNNGAEYTHNNLKNDLKSLILEKRPEILFVSDFDEHQDHKAVSMFTEKVIGEILKENTDYKPIVYKGFAYSTAWAAPDDFYSLNAVQTLNVQKDENVTTVYSWDERIRFPVSVSTLSRSAFTSSLYDKLCSYDSQNAKLRAVNIVNGDKVFWQGRTDSILYNALFTTDSGDSALLNDFLLLDSSDIAGGASPYKDVWTPDDVMSDSVRVLLNEISDIDCIYIYDHPSAEDNITNIKIVFDDGDEIETGKLDPCGAASAVRINKKGVSSFELKIISYEGTSPGITEIEAYKTSDQYTESFFKIIDKDENFVYDYIVESESNDFSIYSNKKLPELSEAGYEVKTDNENCSVKIENGKIRVVCPEGECCLITLKIKNGDLSDTVYLRNVSNCEESKINLSQSMEHFYFKNYITDRKSFKNLSVYHFLFWIKSLFV
ncbi:MAG: PIG-L family deacetylase, partial [Clostridia bacterium]|nr:PIG-L family deacetylase [Clostridia bacterium]